MPFSLPSPPSCCCPLPPPTATAPAQHSPAFLWITCLPRSYSWFLFPFIFFSPCFCLFFIEYLPLISIVPLGLIWGRELAMSSVYCLENNSPNMYLISASHDDDGWKKRWFMLRCLVLSKRLISICKWVYKQ